MPPTPEFLNRAYKHYIYDYQVCMKAYWSTGEMYEFDSAMHYLRQAKYYLLWYTNLKARP